MSKFLQNATSEGSCFDEARAAAEHLYKDFPAVYAILTGEPASTGFIGRLPGSIRLFTNGTELKAMLSGREWVKDGYIVVPKQVDIIGGIEEELQAGRIGWSAASGQKNSYKQPSH